MSSINFHSSCLWQPYSSTFLGPISDLQFDPNADLLWTRSSTSSGSGTVTSYLLADNVLRRYTSFKTPSTIRHLIASQRAILSLSHHSLQANNRRALPIWSSTQSLQDAHSIAFSSTKSTEILVAGAQPQLLLIHAANGTLIRTIDLTPPPATAFSPITHVRRSQSLVACGASSGTVTLRDPNSLKDQHSFMAHYAGLEQMETEGNYLVTCGLSLKLQGHPVRDPLVKVFDVRALRPLPPINFPSIPSLVRFHPRMSSTLFIASALGQLEILDILNPLSSVSFQQLDCSNYLTDLAIASSGEALAYADSDGLVHLWTTAAEADQPRAALKWSRQSQPLELPDDPPEPLPALFDWQNEATPLSSIGMPYYATELASVLPIQHYITPYSPLFQPRPPIEPELLLAVHQRHQASYNYPLEQVTYLPHPKKTKRYQASLPFSATSAHAFSNRIGAHPGLGRRRLSIPLFRSEKDKDKDLKKSISKSLDGSEGEERIEDSEEMPKWYRQVEIKYSKFGIEDFDFGFYNSTKYSGLETHIVNSYTNALLQVLYHTPAVKSLAQSHITLNCIPPSCLLCELGFLFRSMESAAGVNCAPTNFSRAFTSNPRVLALALTDLQSNSRSYSSLIQLCHHFLLEQISEEVRGTGLNDLIESIFGTHWRTEQICSNCKFISSRSSLVKAIEIIYPRGSARLSDLLVNSFSRETSAKAVCSQCGVTCQMRWRRKFERGGGSLPPVLAVHAAVSTPEQLTRWAEPGFLSPELTITITESETEPELVVSEGLGKETGTGYELGALVVQVEAADERPHLVALVKVDEDGWYLFNDFLVRKVTQEEALSFKAGWKIPAVLYYRRKEVVVDQMMEINLVPPLPTIDQSILLQDINLSERRDASKIRHVVLREDEMPRKGTLVAIDAEFVSLQQQEEVDYRSDGTRIVRRPSRMSLARVSVLRGSGARKGVPFIDDHIETSEPVTDYLTEYSGIRPGDLDRHSSGHTLVPLKTAYKKLRLLVDLGCIFIGHGLSKDLRIINIHVPPAQIIDTVDLFHIPSRQRKLSLRLLSYVVLGVDIQNSGCHDSIEDAKTALELYGFWSMLQDVGGWEDELEEIYRKGKALVR
ncbi:hypothetical protein CROQUDRAFT_38040 [Cronartium quercuum f. sp. fusiforme G11]|uniref:PAN2-PAN3 deadenylation complex catalytic subunit PAN2 n=1 Tax=Cronartium quercuum f. sp. fusiforme G11 TaxID=708437 RepID=A0A9P6NUI8_9BASI|nr:hypothetical protein CROQUDRAFT_38040 [Cronartium quercuum f. sp. fusiforme G11]